MTNIVKVLGVSGSLREGSFNTKLLHIAQDLKPAGMELTLFSLADLPLYNQDLVTNAYPPAVEAWRDQIKQADAMLFASPEYNYSVTGVLKNAIDWASRPDVGAPPNTPHPLFNKPAAVMGAGGRFGTARGQMHLRQIAVFLNMHILIKPEVYVSLFPQSAFDKEGNLTDDMTKKFITDMLSELMIWSKRFQ